MKINFSTKKPITPKKVKDLPSGTVFICYNEMNVSEDARTYHIVLTRNGHRDYYNLSNGSFRPLNDDCPVAIVDCALTVYGIKE